MIKAVAKGIFSVLALLIGSIIIVWILYNEFIELQPHYDHPSYLPFFGIAPAMIGMGVYWGRQALDYLRGDA